MVSGKKTFIAALVVLPLIASSALAETKTVYLARRLALPSEAIRGVVTISNGSQKTIVVPAVVVSLEGKESVVAARAELSSTDAPFKVLFTAYGKTGEVVAASLELQGLSPEEVFTSDEAALKRRLSDKRGEFKKLEVEDESKRAQLQQLQKGSGLAGGASQGGDRSDETSSVKLAQERLSALKGGDLPPNYKKREAELSAYLNVVSTELKSAKDGADDKLSDASRELLEKRTLVETTKGEHIDLLQAELARLRRQRQELEGQPSKESSR